MPAPDRPARSVRLTTIGASNTGSPEAMRPSAAPCHTPRFCAWADGPNATTAAHKPAKMTTQLAMASPFSRLHMGTFTGNASDVLYRRSARFAVIATHNRNGESRHGPIQQGRD